MSISYLFKRVAYSEQFIYIADDLSLTPQSDERERMFTAPIDNTCES